MTDNTDQPEQPIKRGFFALIPSVVLADERLSQTAKLIFGELFSLADENGQCYPSNKHLADLLRIHNRQVQNCLTKLNELGLIEIEITNFNKRLITISLCGWEKNRKGSNKKDTPPCNILHTPMQLIAPPIYENNKENNNKTVKPNDNNTLKDKSLIVLSSLGDKSPQIDKRDLNISSLMAVLEELLGHKPIKEKLQRFACKRLIGKLGSVEKVESAIRFAFASRAKDQYAPGIYNYLDLEEKLDRLIDYGNRAKNKLPRAINVSEMIRQKKALEKGEPYVLKDPD